MKGTDLNFEECNVTLNLPGQAGGRTFTLSHFHTSLASLPAKSV
jgi:hypothetical protein